MKESWKFEKGNSPELPTVSKSEHPIPKDHIDPAILDYIYNKVEVEQKQLLEISDFNLNFLCWSGQTVFLELNITSGNGSKIDLKLIDQDAKNFVDLIRNTQFDNKPGNN